MKKKRVFKRWFENVLVIMEFVLIISLGMDSSNIVGLLLHNITVLSLFTLIAYFLMKYGRLMED